MPCARSTRRCSRPARSSRSVCTRRLRPSSRRLARPVTGPRPRPPPVGRRGRRRRDRRRGRRRPREKRVMPEEPVSDEAEAVVEDVARRRDRSRISTRSSPRSAKERDELRELAQRVQADFENYRKRMLRDQTEAIARANEDARRGAAAGRGQRRAGPRRSSRTSTSSVRKGIELVFAELVAVLEQGRHRAHRRAPTSPFDPNVHEAVMQEGEQRRPRRRRRRSAPATDSRAVCCARRWSRSPASTD